MRSALLLPSQNALDQLSRFPRPSQERINYLVQEFRQQIIDLRTANRLPTIVTTNLAQADFDAAGAERIASRFNQVLYPVKCTWSDFRKRSALKNLKPEEVF